MLLKYLEISVSQKHDCVRAENRSHGPLVCQMVLCRQARTGTCVVISCSVCAQHLQSVMIVVSQIWHTRSHLIVRDNFLNINAY